MDATTMADGFIDCCASERSSAEDSEDYEGDFATVARFLNPTDAHIVAACLHASGIAVLVADANLVQANALWAIAAGGARILVAAAHLDEARAVIAAYERGEFALPDEDDPSGS